MEPVLGMSPMNDWKLTDSLHALHQMALSSGMSERALSEALTCHVNWKTVDTSILGLTISVGQTRETFSGVLLQDAKDLIGADKVTKALNSFPSPQKESFDDYLDMTVVRPEHRKVHEMMNPLILELYKNQRMLYDADIKRLEPQIIENLEAKGDIFREQIAMFNQQIGQNQPEAWL